MLLPAFTLWLILTIHLAYALVWDGPRVTSAQSLVITPTPKPTQPPELAKRDAWPASFCGFVGGISSLAASCSPHSSCVWNTDYFVVGCCATASQDCLFFTSCIDENSPSTAADDSLVFTCRGTKTCYQNNYPSNYRQWGCGFNATFIALTYSNMSADAATIQQAFIGTAELAAVTTVTSIVTSTDPISPSAGSSGGGRTMTGIIVGAAVGGSALLAVGAIIITCLLLRRHKQQTKSAREQPLSQPTSPSVASPNLTMPQNVMGFHQPAASASYFVKDPNVFPHFPPVAIGSALSYDNSLQTDWSHATQVDMTPEGISTLHRQPRSPPRPPRSPALQSLSPREMDAGYNEITGTPRTALPGQDDLGTYTSRTSNF